MELMILVGPPGSGKTEYAKGLELIGFTRINQDDQGKKYLELFEQAIANKENIVVDRMNFSLEQRMRFYEKAAGYDIKTMVFHVPYKVCLERCVKRIDHPTIKNEKTAKSALDTFFTKYERVEETEFSGIQVFRWGWNDYGKPAIISDLDGTLCNLDHRLHYIKAEKKNWKSFLSEIDKDIPYDYCVKIIEAMLNSGYMIVLCSGRSDEYKEKTEQWLGKYGIYYDSLFMRPAKDYRKDYIIKEILLEFEIKTRYNVLFALDDRQQVVDVFRKHDIRVLQVQKGDF